jgi:hypothetical protein
MSSLSKGGGKSDINYYSSSATFYETGIDEFGFLNNLYTVFDRE